MAEPLPEPTKDGEVTEYTVLVYEDEPFPQFEVPLVDEQTRLVVKVRPRPLLFSL